MFFFDCAEIFRAHNFLFFVATITVSVYILAQMSEKEFCMWCQHQGGIDGFHCTHCNGTGYEPVPVLNKLSYEEHEKLLRDIAQKTWMNQKLTEIFTPIYKDKGK